MKTIFPILLMLFLCGCSNLCIPNNSFVEISGSVNSAKSKVQEAKSLANNESKLKPSNAKLLNEVVDKLSEAQVILEVTKQEIEIEKGKVAELVFVAQKALRGKDKAVLEKNEAEKKFLSQKLYSLKWMGAFFGLILLGIGFSIFKTGLKNIPVFGNFFKWSGL